MPVERYDDPEEEAKAAKAFFDTLGPVMLVSAWDSSVMAVRDAETHEMGPAVLVRFEGRVNQGIEPVTSTILLSPEDTEQLVQMLAEQAVIAKSIPMSEWVAPEE